MYIERSLISLFNDALNSFPAVLITGPPIRKKTFLKNTLKDDYNYISFDDPLNRDFASQDPRGFYRSLKKGALYLMRFSMSRIYSAILKYSSIQTDAPTENGY